MKFPIIEIDNFLAITQAKISLADRGLVAIQGENKSDTSADSNGAGKSSIADALCWAWYGTTARGASGDEVINDNAGKNTRVLSTLLDDDGMTYTITRYRKHTKGKNRLELSSFDGIKTVDLTKGTDKMTQVEATRIIGSSLDVFAGSIYAGQERMPDLPNMTDKALKVLIEEAAGVTVLEEAYKASRQAVIGREAELTIARTSIHGEEKSIEGLQEQIVNLNMDKDRIAEANAVRCKELTTIVLERVTDIKNMDVDIALFDPAAIINAIAESDDKIANVGKEQKFLNDQRAKVAEVKTRVSLCSSNLVSTTELMAKDEAKRDALASTVGSPCPDCGRPITESEIAARKTSIQKNIDESGQWIKNEAEKLERIKVVLAEVTKIADDFEAQMTDISEEQIVRSTMQTRKEEHDRLVGIRSSSLTAAQANKAEIETIRSSINPITPQIERVTKQIEAQTNNLNALKKAAEVLDADLEVDRQVVRVFAPNGARSRILDEVTPFLNAQTAKYLSVLSDGNISATWSTVVPTKKAGEYKEKFTIEVVNDKGGKSFKTISGGEKRKVRISTALALQDLVATRATKPIDLFIGDEIDDALDGAGLERLMTILEEKASEKGSVFIISHNELTDYIKNILKIEKKVSGETEVTEITV